METKDTAVALLKEWKHQEIASNPFSSWAWDPEYQKEISQRLDEMAGAAGIQLHVDGMVSFSKFGDKTDDMVCPRIYVKELHAILEWLLIKNEEKTA